MRNCDRDGNKNVRSDCRWQELSLSLIVGARHSFEVLDCRVTLWPSGALVLAFERGAAAEAIDVDFENRGVVNEAIDSGERHGGIWKDFSPGAERLICRDQGGSALVSSADQLEQHGGFRLILADVGEIIEDQEIEAVEPVDGGLQCQFAARHLKSAYQASLDIRERLARADPSNAGWQRDLFVSYYKLGEIARKTGKPAWRDYWQRAYEVLSSMMARGLFVSQNDTNVLAQLRARLEEPDPFIHVDTPMPDPKHDAKRAQQLNIEYQQKLAAWETLPWWKRWRTPEPKPPEGI